MENGNRYFVPGGAYTFWIAGGKDEANLSTF
jgi:hypothetical protein